MRGPRRRSRASSARTCRRVFGLVIMNTAIWSSSWRFRSSRSTVPVGVLLTVTASKPAIAALAGLVPWALSGTRTFGALLAAIAEVGGGDQQRGQFAVRAGGRLQRAGGRPAISCRYSCNSNSSCSMPCSVASG